MHRICLTLASLMSFAVPVFAADLGAPLLYKVEQGVNVWAPAPIPVSLAPELAPVPVLVVNVKQTTFHTQWLPDAYVTGPRWPGYMGDYPARFPF